MKQLLKKSGIGLLLVCSACHADVPQNVQNTFTSTYKNASHISWDLEDNYYEAEFKIDNLNYSILYNNDAQVMETETEMKQIPIKIQDYIKINYSSQQIQFVAKIEKPNQPIQYEVELKDKEGFTFGVR